VKWTVLIYADGDLGVRGAAKRLQHQLVQLDLFSEILIIDANWLVQRDAYFKRLHMEGFLNNRGHGYWVWKPIAINYLLRNRNSEDLTGIVYVDAGCEVITNLIAKKKFNTMLSLALSDPDYGGVIAFESIYEEERFCKIEVITGLNLNRNLLNGKQMQASWFVIGNNLHGQEFVNRWYAWSIANDSFYISDTLDLKIQSLHFNQHRHDQSLFSLAFKSLNLKPYGVVYRNMMGTIRNAMIPIWVSRNKSPKTIVKKRAHNSLTSLVGISLNFLIHLFQLSYNQIQKISTKYF
jgi:hypothetical protein